MQSRPMPLVALEQPLAADVGQCSPERGLSPEQRGQRVRLFAWLSQEAKPLSAADVEQLQQRRLAVARPEALLSGSPAPAGAASSSNP
jgi:hypothetical protein